MNSSLITHCPGTLAQGHTTYSRTTLKRMFQGAKVHHILPYQSPATSSDLNTAFVRDHMRVSISGVQAKFSLIQIKNKLRLVMQGEQGTHLLKVIPSVGSNVDQMPANEHLTMQIARQVYNIETAENALIFFQDGEPAFLTKRFDVGQNNQKNAVEDFAALAGRSPQTDGEQYKYMGNYLQAFQIMKTYLPAYPLESLRLFKLIVFNYLFSNGDAHFKNFSIIETELGDFRLSPAYHLLNSRLHVKGSDFALADGLLPRQLAQGTEVKQFYTPGQEAGLKLKQIQSIFNTMLSNSSRVEALIGVSFLNERLKRGYLQAYQSRVKTLGKI